MATPPFIAATRFVASPDWIPSDGVSTELASTAGPRRNVVRRALGFLDRRALADCVPLFLPAIPFAFVVGLAITESSLPQPLGWLTSIVIFAGAAQLAVITLAGTASLWAVAIAGIVINTRHVMYSAAMSTTFRSQPRWMRLLGPFVLIDQVFALTSLQADRDPAEFRRYYLSCGLFFYVCWASCVSLGMVFGPVVPSSWRLDFAPPIMFAGMVVLMVRDRPALVAAIVGATTGLAAAGLRDRLGILVGAVAGVLAGTLAEARRDRQLAATDAGDAGQTRMEPS